MPITTWALLRAQWRLSLADNPPRVKPLLDLYRVLLTGIDLTQMGKIEANLNNLSRKFKQPYILELIELKVRGTEREKLLKFDLEFHQQ